MGIKITRDSGKETNKTTALWLYEFGFDLSKNAHQIDYLRDYLDSLQKTKKFSSIEEKLADMRARVGLDLATKISNELQGEETKVAHKNCGCQKKTSENCSCEVKTAQAHPEKDVATMQNILDYIQDMVQKEPHLNAAIVIARCKDEDGLHFDRLQKKIDHGKLIRHINSLLDQAAPKELESVHYIPAVVENEYSAEDQVAEYYNHATPSR